MRTHQIRFSLLASVVLVLLCSCNPGPKYARPPAQAPTAFKEATPQEYKEGTGWKIAQPGDDSVRGKWWEMYNDPTLNALEEQVPVSNQSILASEANFRAARALVVSARSALFPTITTSPSFSNSRFSTTARTTQFVGGTATTTGPNGTGTSTPGHAERLNPHDAEDLTQEAFCKAQMNFSQLRDPGRARPWLFSILRNAYLHRARDDRQHPCVPLEAAGELGWPATETWSGAGHDAQHLAALFPTLLVFVPLHGGESHSPGEGAEMDEIVQSAAICKRVLLTAASRYETTVRSGTATGRG